MASVKLILRQHQTDKAGHSPLYLRVIKDRKTKFITTGVKLLPNEWDEAKQKIKKNLFRIQLLIQNCANMSFHLPPIAENLNSLLTNNLYKIKNLLILFLV